MNKARNNIPTPLDDIGNMNGRTTPNGMNGNMNGMNGGAYPNNMNGRTGMGGTQGRNANGGALTGTLAEQIRALCFVKTELELYLDTHPRCRTALDYYYQTVEELKRLTEQYENTTGPLTAMGNTGDSWQWINGPWPWQQAGDFMRGGNR